MSEAGLGVLADGHHSVLYGVSTAGHISGPRIAHGQTDNAPAC